MKKWCLIIGVIVVISAIVPTVVFAGSELPSKEDVKQFMFCDQTDKNEYIIGEYVCKDFVKDVIENASKCGFKAYSIGIHVVSDTNETHIIVLFKTSDGDVYVDATQADNWAYIDFDTMKYESYSMLNDKLVLSTYIDWYRVCD